MAGVKQYGGLAEFSLEALLKDLLPAAQYISNVKMMHGDATEFLQYWCEDGIVDVIHLYFSDPWPKTRHHKRRVIQDRTLQTFYRILKPDGIMHVVTDHEDLWQWCKELFDRNTQLFRRGDFNVAPSAGSGELVGTNFERKYQKEGRPFHATTITKVEPCTEKE